MYRWQYVYSILTGANSGLERTSRNVPSTWAAVCLSGKEGQGCPSRRVSAFEPSSPNDVGKFAQQILTQTKVCVRILLRTTQSRSLDTSFQTGCSVSNALYSTMRSPLVQKAVKDSFVDSACSWKLMYCPYVTINISNTVPLYVTCKHRLSLAASTFPRVWAIWWQLSSYDKRADKGCQIQ